MQVQETNFLEIQGWMRTELGLTGNDLLVYATIYGFSQIENQKFTGSLQYLADWCGATKQGIQKNLKNLISRNLITKEQLIINGVTYVAYYAPKVHGGYAPKVHGMHLRFTNNISHIDNLDNSLNKPLSSKGLIEVKKDIDIERDKGDKGENRVLELYNDRCNKLPKARQLSEKRKKAIRAILKKYSLDEIIQVFDKANASDFLTGKNDRGWVADFDFIFREDKFLSILEGKYNGKKKSIDGLASAPRATKEDKNERVYHF